jgi:hypothetical protein
VTTTKTATHSTPYTRETHRGTLAACAKYPCKPHREALGILRETAPLSPAEQAAANAIRDAQWILWHADDRDLAVALILSRAGLLRDRAYEQQQNRAAAIDTEHRDRRRRTDATTISRLTELIGWAATQLDNGHDPARVAEQLRAQANRASADRDHHAA